jgi:hypothetical protein
MTLLSSSRASLIRSVSFESTTKISPCVPVKSIFRETIVSEGYRDRKAREPTVLPQLPDTLLAANVPDSEPDVLVLDFLYVEP